MHWKLVSDGFGKAKEEDEEMMKLNVDMHCLTNGEFFWVVGPISGFQ